jgi:hypothetical protein
MLRRLPPPDLAQVADRVQTSSSLIVGSVLLKEYACRIHESRAPPLKPLQASGSVCGVTPAQKVSLIPE